MTTTTTNPTADSLRAEEFSTMADPQRAAERIASLFANGTIPIAQDTRRGLGDQLGVRKPRRRRGRSETSKALAEQILEDQ